MTEEAHIGEDLAAFVGAAEALGTEERARLERHLESCSECRSLVAESQRVSKALESSAIVASPDFDRRLFAKLDELDASARTEERRERWRALMSPLRWGLVAGPVAAGLAWFTLSRPREEGSKGLPEGAMGALGALDELELGAELELYQDLDAVEYLDVAEDLELLLDDEEAG